MNLVQECMLRLQSQQTEKVDVGEGTQEPEKKNECSQQNITASDENITKTANHRSDQEWEDLPKTNMAKKNKFKSFKVKKASATKFQVKHCVNRYSRNKIEQMQKEKARLEVKVNQLEEIIVDLKIKATDANNMPTTCLHAYLPSCLHACMPTPCKFMEDLNDANNLNKFMQEEIEVLEKKLIDGRHEASQQHSVVQEKLTEAYKQCDIKDSDKEELEKKLLEETHRSYEIYDCFTKLDELMDIERIVVKKEQDQVAKLEQAVVILEMQVAEAGNEKMVGFLLELIERKQRFLECPVCLEEASSPILCCPQLHLICSSCLPSLGECPECRTRYGGEGARRHRHAESVAEELEGLREQLRQLTS